MQFRNTKQKSMIFSTIHKHGHLTVEQIKDLLSDEKVSIATIYRNLNILTLEGKIKKIYSEDLIVYETIKEEHYHFECLKCKNVIDIDPKFVNIKIDHSIANATRKTLFLYGICPNCQK
jgi:Fe2+ or Zn2+ uptake regulation protein